MRSIGVWVRSLFRKPIFLEFYLLVGGEGVDFIPYDYFLAANLGHQLRYH